MRMTLRVLLNAGREEAAFKQEGVADVEINSVEVETRLAAMQRAVVAHQALNTLLLADGGEGAQCDNLLQAIDAAFERELISRREANWFRHYNRVANKAEHLMGQVVG